MVLSLDLAATTEGDLIAIRDLIFQRPGKRRVELLVKAKNGRQMRLIPADEFAVEWNPEVQKGFARWL